MKITVLGCSGAIAAGCKTSSFLVDDDVLIDAGTGVGDLPLEALARIDHIFISHSHLDHIVSIGLLADSVMRLRQSAARGPIRVMALPETLAALRTHILNGVIWPDFTRLPSPERPVLELQPIAIGQVIALGQRQIEVLSAAHTVPACGFAVFASSLPECAAWVYTGDTGPNPALWQRLSHMRVAHLVIETAFGDDETALAQASQHLAPNLLATELSHLSGSVDVHITHIKPGELETVMGQIDRIVTPHRLHAISAGDHWNLPG
jgi:ribonuclease BN (tRNA processing enzyme)